MKTFYILIVLTFISAGLIGQSPTAPTIGDGSSTSPWEITDLNELEWVAQEVNNDNESNSYFIQTADIDASNTSNSNYNSGNGWKPIGADPNNANGAQFTGSYNGQDYTINNLDIDRSGDANVGLFGHIGIGAKITNLGLTSVEINGTRGTGSLVGRVTGDETTVIEYCYADGGTVVGDGATGGLVGSNNSYETNPANAEGKRPKILKSYANVDVTWSQNGDGDKIGGLAGCNQKGRVQNSYALGDVTVDNSTTANSTEERVGGLVGCTYLRGVVENSYSAGQVTAKNVDRVGGLVGYRGTGNDEGTVTASYYDDYSGLSGSNPDLTNVTNDNTIGKTSTTNMKDINTFSADWNIATTNNLSSEIWGIDDGDPTTADGINNGYPYLTAENSDSPLPVELLSLTATKADNVITVSWVTASETNNNFFEVQVSEDGYAYSVAGTVSGAGNSNERRDYDFDYSESNAIEYIRLRQVDYDGADELYGPVYVEQHNDEGHNPEVYPNPVESDFYVSFPDPLESETRVRLFNSMGQRIKNITLQPGNQKTHIQISNDMPAGMYFLKIDGSVNTTQKINIR